ncbi:MAG TPA: ROK family protein [Tepidisphaeraceae bacterium]|jgi:glucokinase
MDATKPATTLGVDIGGTSVKTALWVGSTCVRTGQSPFYARPTTDQLLAAIRAAVGSAARELGTVGLCVPGLLDADRRVVTLSVNVPGLAGYQLDQLVPQALGLPTEPSDRQTTISNDATASAYDIFQTRKLTGRLLVIALGTGVGAAVLDDGIPLRVEGDSPGHIGQMDVSIAGSEVIGPDGGAGGLEGYIGAPALRRRLGPDLTAGLRDMAADDPAILALVRALRICHAIYRPQHICLCGGVGIRLRHLLRAIYEKTADRLTSVSRSGWSLDCGIDDFHAARGAAQLAAAAAGNGHSLARDDVSVGSALADRLLSPLEQRK